MKSIKVSERWTTEPAPREIFGQFVESGFGRQVSGMWSEMLYNRSFRRIQPYRRTTWEWLGLDEDHYNDAAPFWHSGYEEYDWEDAGAPEKDYTIGTHTFKGIETLRIRNGRPGEICGLRQRGLHLEKGRHYTFELTAALQLSLERAGLNGFGEGVGEGRDKREVRIRIGRQETAFLVGAVTETFRWKFEAAKTETVSAELTFTFGDVALIPVSVSLMPDDNIHGWRRDVVEQLRDIRPPVVRFPGGCFASFYDWQNTVGPRESRWAANSFYWGGLEENDAGLDEFLCLADMVGFKPQICINMMTSDPFRERQLVEYLNAPPDIGMGRLRRLNGHEEPYGVTLFEMDNETGRKWTAVQYARECVSFAREMRLADPGIRLMMCCYSYAEELLPEMLKIAGRDINYVIYREGEPAFVRRILGVLRDYNAANGTQIRLVNTEWLAPCRSCEPFEAEGVPTDFSWNGTVTNDWRTILSTQQMSWNYALNGAQRLLEYISFGGEFALANFNNLCNTWGQNVIEATKDTCYKSCMGRVFAFFAREFTPCTAALAQTGEEQLFALMTRSREGREKLYMVNHTSESMKVRLPEMADGTAFTAARVLYAEARLYGEREDRHVVKEREIWPDEQTMTVPALSLVCVETSRVGERSSLSRPVK